jgi:HSP20 family protein
MVIRALDPRAYVRHPLPPRLAAHSIFDELWRDFGVAPAAGEGAFVPRIDVTETADEMNLTAELPGLENEDFEVTVDGDVITIKGEKKVPRKEASTGFVRTVRSSGAFSRSFRFPFDVDFETVSGSYRNGVLRVVVPKPDRSSQVRTVPIATA